MPLEHHTGRQACSRFGVHPHELIIPFRLPTHDAWLGFGLPLATWLNSTQGMACKGPDSTGDCVLSLRV